MEIKSLYTLDDHEEGSEVCINGPDGNKTDLYINVMGCDSHAYRKKEREVRAKVIRSLRDDSDMGEFDEDLEMMTHVTIGWRGLKDGGVDVPFSKDAAKKLYVNAPYIRQQVNEFVVNRKNFIKG